MTSIGEITSIVSGFVEFEFVPKDKRTYETDCQTNRDLLDTKYLVTYVSFTVEQFLIFLP